MKEVVVLGSGGHAKVVMAIIEANKDIHIAAVLDNDKKKHGSKIMDYVIRGDDSELDKLFQSGISHAIIGIGSVRTNSHRMNIYNKVKAAGFDIPVLLHSSSILTGKVYLGEGVQVMAGSILQTGAAVGDNVIINTGSIVEHDSRIGNHCHVAPGVTIGGDVDISEGVFVGIGSSIRNGIKIGKNAVIGAGSVVISDVLDNTVVAGVPAKVLGLNEQ